MSERSYHGATSRSLPFKAISENHRIINLIDSVGV